jgi:hypothetical protein
MSINGGLPKAGDDKVLVFFQVKNGGRSIAFVKFATLAMGFGNLPSKPYYGNEPQRARAAIPPEGIANDSDSIVLGRALTQADVDALKAGTLRMSVFGYLRYTDTYWLFGGRINRFCLTYTPEPTGASQFETCPETNYTYED